MFDDIMLEEDAAATPAADPAPAPEAKSEDSKPAAAPAKKAATKSLSGDVSSDYATAQKLDVWSGAMGRVMKTYQGFGGLNDIERIMGQTEKNPILLRNADGTKIWQGTFFHTGYYYWDASKPDR